MPSDFEFIGEANRMLLAMQVLADVDIEQVLATVDSADTLGPLLDPTAYRDALYRGDMHAVRDLAAALREPVRVWNDRIAPKAPGVNGETVREELSAAVSEYRHRHGEGPVKIALGSEVAARFGREVYSFAFWRVPVYWLGASVFEDEHLDSHAFELRGPVLCGLLGDGVPS